MERIRCFVEREVLMGSCFFSFFFFQRRDCNNSSGLMILSNLVNQRNALINFLLTISFFSMQL